MFGFWWRRKKRDGGVCSVFDVLGFLEVFFSSLIVTALKMVAIAVRSNIIMTPIE